MELQVIATIENDFSDKFGIPRQSGLAEQILSRIIFEPAYRDENMLRGLEEYSHLWLLWGFSKNYDQGWSPTVRPPRLGGNTRKGVFATRAPIRPNPIGMSCVRLLQMERDPNVGTILYVSGADLMNGTPIFDIKPYLPYVDCHPDANGGFSEKKKDYRLQVTFTDNVQQQIDSFFVKPADQQQAETLHRQVEALKEILSLDPRPSYQNDPERIYGFTYGPWNVKFQVQDGCLTVLELLELDA